MNQIIAALTLLFIASPSLALEPIPGSITYGGGPKTMLTKSPIGASVLHSFRSGGYEYQERYVLQPDRNLKLVSRGRIQDR